MAHSILVNETEQKVWEAAITGVPVDLQSRDPALNSLEKGAEWGTERTVRAEVIKSLLIGEDEAKAIAVRGVHIQGAHIAGELNLEATTLRCPLALLGCFFDNPVNLNEVTAMSVKFSRSHIPAIYARQLRTSGDFELNKVFGILGGVDLAGACIGGMLDCEGSQFSNANANGRALNALRLAVKEGMYCHNKFEARGEVNLVGARIGYGLDCTNGKFISPGAYALRAYWLTVKGEMHCKDEFEAQGEVNLVNAHIRGEFDCTGGKFTNENGDALDASGLNVDQDMCCGNGFEANGKVSLLGAHIKGEFDCDGGKFISPNPDNVVLDLERATVSGPLRMKPDELQGILDLTATKAGSYHDSQSSRQLMLRLDRFIYDAIDHTDDRASLKDRIEWLRRNKRGYSPQIYEHLAAVYHCIGNDEDSKRVLIEKQRQRFEKGDPVIYALGLLFLDWTVGYGYRMRRALYWFGGFWILGVILFGHVCQSDFKPAKEPKFQPSFDPMIYTLDLLFPVANLHAREAWITTGIAQVLSVIFIIVGWALATIVVLALTGFFKRDIK